VASFSSYCKIIKILDIFPNLQLSNSQRRSIYTTSETGVKYTYICISSISFIRTLSEVRLQHLEGFQLGIRLNNEDDAFLLSFDLAPPHAIDTVY
jgi:hypothetical protein